MGLLPLHSWIAIHMRINKPATLTSANASKMHEVAYVVIGDGHRAGSVKSLKYGRQHSKSRLKVSKIRKPGHDDEYELSLTKELEERGWLFLREAYDEDGNPDGYLEYMEFIVACHDGRVEVKFMTEEQKSQIVAGFPDKLLPTACRRLADSRGPIGGKWSPSSGWDDDDDLTDAEVPLL